MRCACGHSRRGMLALLAAGISLAACSENAATGRNQFVVAPDEALAEKLKA